MVAPPRCHFPRLAVADRLHHHIVVRDDPFETVAIAYSQPQALVLLSLFAWHGLAAHARALEHARVDCPVTLALGGIPIRVRADCADDARALLEEAAAREIDVGHDVAPLAHRVAKVLVLGILGATPPPRIAASIID